jgi:hypothetical protein
MILLIDDQQDTDKADVIIRSTKACRTILQKKIKWDKIYFGYFLGNDYEEDNGLKILTWALENDLLDKDTKIFIIAINNRHEMEEVLIKFGYRMPLNSFDFIKIK